MPGPYIFKQIFAADPSNTSNVATNASILLFAPGDPAMTPLVITDASTGLTLANPVQTNTNGFGPTFAHESLDQVAWEGGGFSGTFESWRGLKDDAETAAESASLSAAAAVTAAEEAATAVQEALAGAVSDAAASRVAAEAAAGLVGAPAGAAVLAAIQPGGAAHGELSAAIGPKLDKSEATITYATKETVSEASDPLAHLTHVESFLSVIARPIPGYFPQCFSVNEADGHVYIAFLATVDAERKIMIQIWDQETGVKVREKTATTSYTDAGTEGLPWFRNGLGDLCFIVRGGSGGYHYQIFNFDTGAVGSPVLISGAHKSAQDGAYFYTCSSGSSTSGVDTVYVYDWASIKAESPVLVAAVKLDVNPYPTKVQSFTVNNGYILFNHGGHKEPAWVSAYDLTGRFVRMFGITPEDMLSIAQDQHPALGLNSLINHESEGAAVWHGQLLTGHAVWNDDDTANGPFMIMRHNVPSGRRFQAVAHQPKNDWVGSTLYPGIVASGASLPSTVREGRVGFLEGIVSGLSGNANINIATIDKQHVPRKTRRYTCPVIGSSGDTATIVVTTSGLVMLLGTNHPAAATAPTTVQYQLDTSWRVETT